MVYGIFLVPTSLVRNSEQLRGPAWVAAQKGSPKTWFFREVTTTGFSRQHRKQRWNQGDVWHWRSQTLDQSQILSLITDSFVQLLQLLFPWCRNTSPVWNNGEWQSPSSRKKKKVAAFNGNMILSQGLRARFQEGIAAVTILGRLVGTSLQHPPFHRPIIFPINRYWR